MHDPPLELGPHFRTRLPLFFGWSRERIRHASLGPYTFQGVLAASESLLNCLFAREFGGAGLGSVSGRGSHGTIRSRLSCLVSCGQLRQAVPGHPEPGGRWSVLEKPGQPRSSQTAARVGSHRKQSESPAAFQCLGHGGRGSRGGATPLR